MVTTVLKKTTDAYTRMVIDAIQSKIGGRTLTCPVSQDSHWEVQEYQGMFRFNDYAVPACCAGV